EPRTCLLHFDRHFAIAFGRRSQVAAERLVRRAQSARMRNQRGELLFEQGQIGFHGIEAPGRNEYRRRAARTSTAMPSVYRFAAEELPVANGTERTAGTLRPLR